MCIQINSLVTTVTCLLILVNRIHVMLSNILRPNKLIDISLFGYVHVCLIWMFYISSFLTVNAPLLA